MPILSQGLVAQLEEYPLGVGEAPGSNPGESTSAETQLPQQSFGMY